VFSVEGEFIRHVGVGVLSGPMGVAASAFDELVVADAGNHRVAVFSAAGDLAMSMTLVGVTGVVIHGGTIVAQHFDGERCVIFT
jgi:hypothetical protein